MQIKTLSLLQAKISELRTALFFCEDQEALPYAAYLVEVLKMDEQGCIWLYINKQTGQKYQGIGLFPVSLEFYRKGIPYTIDVKGMASIEEDRLADKLLLKITIGQLKYNEFITTGNIQPLEVIGKVVRNLFYIPGPLDDYLTAE